MYRSPSKEMKDSRVSISTVDSETFRAPGLYTPKDEEKVKQVVFGKDRRFKQEKNKYEGMPIYVN